MKKIRSNYLNNQVRKVLDDFNDRYNLGYDKLENFCFGTVEDELTYNLYRKNLDNSIIIFKRALSNNNFTLKTLEGWKIS